jgi:ubiquinone/menaquinone biosynthesis C-methylase UbiE
MTDSHKDAYGRIAKFYDRLLEPVNAPLRAIGWKMHPTDESMTVLDVGCGTGAYLEAYANSGAECFGLDASPAMLEEAETRLGDRANLELGDATELPHSGDSFEFVFASLFLHALDANTRAEALAEMARVTKPGGRVLIIDYATGSLRTKGWVTRSISVVAERVAGKNHYRNWREYLATDGIPSMAPAADLTVERERIVAGGNLGLWLLAPGS